MNDMKKECGNCKYCNLDTYEFPCCECQNAFRVNSKEYENTPLLWKSAEETEDVVNHPSHYETGQFECIDVMIETQGIEAVKYFCQCNAFKYLYRAKRKNGLEDMKKAIWYLNKYVELEERG